MERLRVSARERALLEAERATSVKEAIVVEREAALVRAYDAISEATSSEDLVHASAHTRSLAAGLARARLEAAERRREADEQRKALVASRVGERKVEILVEGLERAEMDRVRKSDQKAADELAARKRDE